MPRSLVLNVLFFHDAIKVHVFSTVRVSHLLALQSQLQQQNAHGLELFVVGIIIFICYLLQYLIEWTQLLVSSFVRRFLGAS